MDRDRVLGEMAACGLRATELGPDGYLPRDPRELQALMARVHLSVVGGFVPAVLYRPERIDGELEYVTRAAAQLAATGARILVLAAASDHPGYDTQLEMTDFE